MTIKLISCLKETKAVGATFNNNFDYSGNAIKRLMYNIFSKSKKQDVQLLHKCQIVRDSTLLSNLKVSSANI